MKKTTISLLAGLFFLFSFCVTASAEYTELHRVAGEMEELVFQPLTKWQMSTDVTKEEALDPGTSFKKFRKVGIGYFWAKEQTIWLRTMYKVPEKILNIPVKGTKIAMNANIEDYGEIYVNGELKQIFRRSTGYVVLTEDAQPGERFFIVIMARRKSNDAGLIRDISLNYDMLEDLELRVTGYTEAFEGLDTLLRINGQDIEDWKNVLDDAGRAIDLGALKKGRLDDFYASLEKSDEILSPLTEMFRQYTMYLMAYSHIDLAWLWDKQETIDVVWKGTSEKVLQLLEDFPGFIYVANQMHGYRWMERYYPDLFKRIQDAIERGEWEPMGAEWVEPDGNLPSGESYVRQFLYGRKYSIDKFGFSSTVGLTPDSFGYNWNLPQILKKCDMRGFITQKISWNDTTKFPHNIFWWEAPDGTRLLTFFPQGSYGETVDGGKMAAELSNMVEKHDFKGNLVIWGIGDHGGGIPRDYAKRAFGLRDSPIYPKIEFVGGEALYDMLEEKKDEINIPVWDDELYLEYHRGTYTSQSETKNNNRRNEICLENAEKFSSIAAISMTNFEYPFDRIEEAWKMLLFNQFHDILPGSSIRKVYEDADKDYAWIAGECNETLDAALARLADSAYTSSGPGDPVVLFNGLSWERDGLVEIELDPDRTTASVYHEAGEEVPAQIVEDADGSRKAIFVARNVPAMGYAVYRIAGGSGKGIGRRPLSAEGNVLENEYLKVTVDPDTGWISSIVDKRNGFEAVEEGGYAFELQARRELERSNAWDPYFPDDGGHIEMPPVEAVEIVENGPVRATIAVRRKFGEKSRFDHFFSLLAGVPIVYGRLDVDWQERNVFLKSAFHYNLDSDHATYEIPYAAIERTTKPETPAEKAKWEVSGHRWVDYTDPEKDYGVTLLSFNKYGYDAKDNVLRISLLRGTTNPDPEADLGRHSIPYALYPHEGGWAGADSPKRGREYNNPIMAIKPTAHPGRLGVRHSYFSARPGNVVISAVKKAEDGNGYIVRLVETQGTDTDAILEVPGEPERVVETNLVERDLEEWEPPVEGKLGFPIGHYEIKSIRVVF